jgi:hypothetical protein
VFIELVNAGNDKFLLEANQFADITDDEFRATHTGYKVMVGGNKGRKTGFRYANVSLDALPTSELNTGFRVFAWVVNIQPHVSIYR